MCSALIEKGHQGPDDAIPQQYAALHSATQQEAENIAGAGGTGGAGVLVTTVAEQQQQHGGVLLSALSEVEDLDDLAVDDVSVDALSVDDLTMDPLTADSLETALQDDRDAFL